jgi:hypothetical protein
MLLRFERQEINIDQIPDHCPNCHKSIIPKHYAFTFTQDARSLEIIFLCPNLDCERSFIGTYSNTYHNSYRFNYCNFGTLETVNFPEEIASVSPSFIKIYNQAHFAEQHNLTEITGVGYRKALEYLIKDFLIWKTPDTSAAIKGKFLGSCIKEDIKDSNIRKVAERAAWLGNDETHYVRVWEDKDIQDLKKLIQLTVYWVSAELLTDSYEKDMPDKKKGK